MRHLLDVLADFSFLPDLHAVGGCVRDTLLGRPANDVDLATSATPEQATKLAQQHGYRVVPTGVEHGTITILHPTRGSVEVTTFRHDFACDGRRAVIAFANRIEDDLARRDFTINAIALNAKGELVDPHRGANDLKQRVLRFVGDTHERIREDYLRVIRGYRFQARDHLTIHPSSHAAMRQHATRVPERVSVERIVQEIDKAFASPNAAAFIKNLYDSGILTHELVLPELADAHTLLQNPEHHPEGDVLTHTLEVIDRAPTHLRWHALLHDIGKLTTATPSEAGPWNTFHGHEKAGADLIPTIAKRLKLSNDLAESLEVITREHMAPLFLTNANAITPRNIRRFQARVGPHLKDLELLNRADAGDRHQSATEQLFQPLPPGQIKPALMGRHLLERGYRHATHPKRPGELHFKRSLDAAHQHQLDTGTTDLERLLAVATQTEDGAA